MANELFTALFPAELAASGGGKPSGGYGDAAAAVYSGVVKGLGFRAGDTSAAFILARVPNAVALATGLTVELLTVDDANNPDPGKVAVFEVAIGKLTSGTSTLDDSSVTTSPLNGSTVVTSNITTNATTGVATVTSIAVTVAKLNSAAAGDWVMIRIRRLGTNASDTHKGRVILLGVDIRNT